jgi:hypothetical protein
MGSTIPGAAVVAARIGETVVVYSESERVECVVDGAPPQENGRLFIVEPGKPKKVPYEAARFMLDHLSYTGVVRVDVIESEDGTKYDLPKAKAESLAKLKEMDDLRFRRWLSGVIEDYVKRSKPVPSPEESIQRIIDRRGYDLKKYGIVPVGWAETEKIDEIAVLREQVARLTTALNATMKAPSPPPPQPKS